MISYHLMTPTFASIDECLMQKHNEKLDTIKGCCVVTLTPVIYLVQGHVIIYPKYKVIGQH